MGARHSCARDEAGAVACWGDNEQHQIAASGVQFHEPHAVEGFPRAGAAALRCGEYRTCIRTSSGQVLCRGSASGSVMTVALPGPATDFVVHAAGGCAILADGRVACWQSNGGGPSTTSLVVDSAAGATGFAIAATNAERVCVLRAEAAPVCFDALLWAPVPEASKPPSAPEVRNVEVLNDFSGAKQLILAPASRPCARWGDGRIACRKGGTERSWEMDSADELLATNGKAACVRTKDGATRCTPMEKAFGIPKDARRVALSEEHGCAVTGSGARCWGQASHGQLGDGTRYLHETPIRVDGIEEATALGVAETLACAAQKDGRLRCWGTWDPGLRGAWNATPGGPPPTFPGFSPVDIAIPEPALDVSVGSHVETSRLCAKGSKGWRCFASGPGLPPPKTRTAEAAGAVPMNAPSTAFFARAGIRTRSVAPDGFCAVDEKGGLVCGHCGSCTPAEARTLVSRLDDTTRYTQASNLIQGANHAETVVCALSEARKVRCLRARNVPFAHEPAPVPIDEPSIAELADVVSVASLGAPRAEANLTCALTERGAVHCWGEGQYGQLGARAVPQPWSAERIANLPPAVEIGVGGTFACARTVGGQVYCWGSNREGAVPDGAPGERTDPVEVRWAR